MKKIILFTLVFLSLLQAEYDKNHHCCNTSAGYMASGITGNIPLNNYLSPIGTWEALHSYGVNNNPICEGNGINAIYNAGNPVPGYEGQNVYYTSKKTVFYACACIKSDTEFPAIDTNLSKVTFEWENPENRSRECQEINGTVQERLVDCSAAYRCIVNKCTQSNTDFPPEADNQREAFTWKAPQDRSAECSALPYSEQQQRKVDCQDEFRCLVQSCKVERNEPISSYVSPRDGVFHEDIEVVGAYFGLHYSTANLDDDTLAHGWSISSHATLTGNKLYFGSGSLYAITQSRQEENLTVVDFGTEEMLFNREGKLQSTKDLYTKETKLTFGYDSTGHLITITDRFGQTSTLTRDTNGTVTSVVAPTGQTTYLQVDAQSDLAEVQYEDTSSYAFEYEHHLLTVETEPNGNRFLHFFDENGKVVKVIDAEQGEWDFSSTTADSYGSHTVTRASGDVVTYKNHFLTGGILKTEKTLPTGDLVVYENAIDESSSSSTTCGMKTTNIYKKNADGTLYTDPYTHKRVLASSVTTTPSGLRKVTDHSKTYFHAKDGTLRRIDDINVLNDKRSIQRKNFITYRDIGISPEGKRDYLEYDTKMQTPLVVKPYGLAKTTYTYDTQGRLTQETTGRRVTAYTYDSRGKLQSSTNPLHQTTSYLYDAKDRLIQTTYPDGTQESYAYDNNGNLITRTVPTPADHIFGYNGVNKKTAYTSPEQKVTTYSYDKQRRVTKITKPSGKTIDTTYINGRITALTTPEGSTNYTYSCQSNVSAITKGSESIHYAYDGTLLTAIIQSGLLNQSIHYTYNNDFLPTSMTYAGSTENYSYNLDNQPVQRGNFTLTRTNHDRNVTVTDGLYSKLSRINSYGEIQKIVDNVLTVNLKRNDAGQIIRKAEILNGTSSVYFYSYDDKGRLTEAKKGKKIIESYSYDTNGNRASAKVHDINITASYTLDDQLIVYGDNTYRYDEDGYLTEKSTPHGSTTYTYGTLGELKAVETPDANITYVHNANNQRVAKLINGEVVEKYLWADLTTLLATYDKEDNLVHRFEYANFRMPVAMTDANGTKYYLHYDQIGTLKAVSDTNGSIIKEITYDTFGNILTDSNPSFKVPFGFAGGLYDSDTKLTRFGYRDYDAYTGKWTAKDSIGFDGGDSNLYGYVLGDPVDFVDPVGLKSAYDTFQEIITPFQEEIYDYYYLKGCEALLKDYDCGCWSDIECEIKKQELTHECIKQLAKKKLEDLVP